MNNFHALQLMKDNTVDSYWVQGAKENKEHEEGGQSGAVCGGFRGGRREFYGGGIKMFFYKCGEIGHVTIFCTKPCML